MPLTCATNKKLFSSYQSDRYYKGQKYKINDSNNNNFSNNNDITDDNNPVALALKKCGAKLTWRRTPKITTNKPNNNIIPSTSGKVLLNYINGPPSSYKTSTIKTTTTTTTSTTTTKSINMISTSISVCNSNNNNNIKYITHNGVPQGGSRKIKKSGSKGFDPYYGSSSNNNNNNNGNNYKPSPKLPSNFKSFNISYGQENKNEISSLEDLMMEIHHAVSKKTELEC